MKALYALTALLLCLGCSTPQTKRLVNPYEGAAGTAFNVEYKGKIYGITAAHLCRGTGKDGLAIVGSRSISRVPVIAQDNGLDLCVLSEIPGVKPFKTYLGEDTPTEAIALGYPLSVEKEVRSTGEIVGIITQPRPVPLEDNGGCALGSFAKGKTEEGDEVCVTVVLRVVTSTQVYPGNSGGPFLNAKDEVIGVALEIARPDGTPSMILPSPLIASFLDGINATTK